MRGGEVFCVSPIDDSNEALCEAIACAIASNPQQRITFAEYMDLVLYYWQHGYYATKAVNLGSRGDFFTSPHLGADFGELLGEQFVQMWEILGQPKLFTLVEMGAGQGILAADILKYLQQHYPDFFAALEYVIVEKSPILKQEQHQRLQQILFDDGLRSEIPPSPLFKGAWGEQALHENYSPPTIVKEGSDSLVRWCDLEEIPSNSITGCFFSNELVDALPVHRFTLQQGQLREIYVTTAQGAEGQEGRGDNYELLPATPTPFVEVTGEPSTRKLVEYFDLVGIQLPSSAYPNGYSSEVNLAALDWLQMVAQRLQRGYLLTIDYGYPASRYYNQARSQGTLQCYYQHQRHNNPYINIGRQDITAHVDFTSLERWGERCGLHQVGFTRQGLFLMALGMGDRLAALSSNTAQSVQLMLGRRDAVHQLIDPIGLGGFGILVQSKGLTAAEITQPLKGLKIPKLANV